jgi:hypothetical protein
MAGIVPSEEFNEQIKRTVREAIRRQRPNTGPPGRWHKKGGGGGGFIIFRPLQICLGIGSLCDCVEAEVITGGCSSGVGIGDVVRVWDLGRCHFNVPEELLFGGIHGYAHLMTTHESEEEQEQLGLGSCRWVVTGMCCFEQEVYGG